MLFCVCCMTDKAEIRLKPILDISLEQSHEYTFENAFYWVTAIDGQSIQSGAALTFPHFTIIKECLYRVSQGIQTGESMTQLLSTKYPEAVPLRMISINSIAEALFRVVS